MAYSIKNDSYTCDFCNFEMGWEQKDDVHGEMWGCEKCGDNFCSKCFIDRYGKNEYMKKYLMSTEQKKGHVISRNSAVSAV